MIQFLQQNLILVIFILLIIGAFVFYYFVTFKSQMNEVAEKSNYDFWRKIFGKHSRLIAFLLFFIGFPLFIYFVLVPIFSVDISTIETVEQAKEHVINSTNSLTSLHEKGNNFFGDIIEKGQQNSFIGGLIILGIGVILLIAIIMDANWILDSSGRGFLNFMLRVLMDSGNRKKARILMLIPTVFIILFGFLMIFGYFAID